MARLKMKAGLANDVDLQDVPSIDSDEDEDRRIDERLTTILRVGKIVRNGIQELCLIRNLSSGGLMANVQVSYAVDDVIEVEVRGGAMLCGIVAWTQEEHIGIRFNDRVNVTHLLSQDPDHFGKLPRAPRLTVASVARVTYNHVTKCLPICDISQGGCRLALAELLEKGKNIAVMIEGLEAVPATVRWCHDGFAGVSFVRPLPFNELAKWVEARNRHLARNANEGGQFNYA
jgi:PilZ domain